MARPAKGSKRKRRIGKPGDLSARGASVKGGGTTEDAEFKRRIASQQQSALAKHEATVANYYTSNVEGVAGIVPKV